MKSIRCLMGIHKYKNTAGRGLAGKQICQRYGDVIPAIIWPKGNQQDALRYRWLRDQYGDGGETYLAEGIMSGQELDDYIDDKLKVLKNIG